MGSGAATSREVAAEGGRDRAGGVGYASARRGAVLDGTSPRPPPAPKLTVPMNDVDFLLKLVHRGLLLEETGKVIFAELQAGGDLDTLLEHHAGLSADVVERWRRTDGGEIPEIPGYEILGKAGTGGTADVWRAREMKTGRVLALKVLKPEAARHAPTRAAFVAEA